MINVHLSFFVSKLSHCLNAVSQHAYAFFSAVLPSVSNFRVIEEGLFSLRLGWTPSLGKVDKYKIYVPRSEKSTHTLRLNMRYFKDVVLRNSFICSQRTDPASFMIRYCRVMPPLT